MAKASGSVEQRERGPPVESHRSKPAWNTHWFMGLFVLIRHSEIGKSPKSKWKRNVREFSNERLTRRDWWKGLFELNSLPWFSLYSVPCTHSATFFCHSLCFFVYTSKDDIIVEAKNGIIVLFVFQKNTIN